MPSKFAIVVASALPAKPILLTADPLRRDAAMPAGTGRDGASALIPHEAILSGMTGRLPRRFNRAVRLSA